MSSLRRSEDGSDEQSALYPGKGQQFEDDLEEDQPLTTELDLEEPIIISKSSWYLFILTLSIGGLQIVWSVELSNGSPYLLSLGMSKSLLAFVWIAGPLSGVLVQPYIGIRSDNCRISWGKRKPFMIGGGVATAISLMLLAWIQEIVGGFLALFGVARESSGSSATVIFFATVSMCVLDFAINTVQAGIRAFIVDNAPAHQQESANAWASRITGVGNVLGYIFGYIDLPRYFPFLGDTQFKVLCVIASLALGSTLLVSCLYIKERDPRLEPPSVHGSPGLTDFFKQVFRSVKRLPPQIRKVCEVQFFSWIGWFPFLFYVTTYIGQLYVNPYLKPGLSEDEIDELWEKATRVGTFALLIYAIVSLLANFLLPFIVEPSYIAKQVTDKNELNSEPISRTMSHRSRRSSHTALPFPLTASTLDAYPTAAAQPTSSVITRRENFMSYHLTKLRVPHLTLRRIWIFSHLSFAICMFSTFFISTPLTATIMAAFVGISWSVTLWVPFALISAEVAQQDEIRRNKLRHSMMSVGRRPGAERHGRDSERSNELRNSSLTPSPDPADPPSTSVTKTDNLGLAAKDKDDGEEEGEEDHIASTSLDLDLDLGTSPSEQDPENQDQDQDQDQDRAGTILGIHNVAISAPQILSTLLSSLVFHFLQRDRHVPGDTSVGWVMRAGGVAALVAAWWGARLGEPERESGR